MGNVEEVWKSEEGDLCARFRVRVDTIPGRAVARMIGTAKNAVSLRHDIVPTGKAVTTPDGAVMRIGKQIRELSVCQYPRREGAIITDKSYTNSPTRAYNIESRTHNTPLVSSAASLVFTEDGSYTMSETAAQPAAPAAETPAAAAPEVTEAAPAAAEVAAVAEVPATPAAAATEAATEAAPAAPATPAKPEIALSGDPMVYVSIELCFD